MNKVIFSALGVFLWRGFLAAEVPAPVFQPDTVVMVPLDSGQVAGQIPVWDGEQWVLVNPGIQGDQFRVDSVGSPSWETTGPTEGYDVGCLDPGACNYMPAAAISFPRMCDYLSCKGCTDEGYLEYSEQALIDDGSCETKLGCLDPNADNFEPEAEGTDGSCTYSGIALEYFGEEDVLPTNLLLFELITQAEDSLYDDIRFYVDGVLEQDTGRSMMWIAGYQPFEVHATALFEGLIRYSDTLLFDPYVSVSQVPVVFDVPIDPDTWLGEGISLVSTVDSLFVSYDEILEQNALELTCDFSSGPEFVVGTVADGDSAKWFSMTYLEAVDTLTISCAKTVTALTKLMPDLAKEEETILNFVEETIPTTTQFDSLVTACSSQIQNLGALSLSALDYVHLNQTASELKAQLPEVALQSSACSGIGSGLFEWPTLMAVDSEIFRGRALKYDNCGSDLSYAVQARSNLVGGGVRTSKTYVFGPELGFVGKYYWKLVGDDLPSVVESAHQLIISSDRARLTPGQLRLKPDADATMSITVKTYGAGVNAVDPNVEDPDLSGEQIQGPLPPFSPGHDFLSHVLDAVVPLEDCGLTDQLTEIGLNLLDLELILASTSLSDEEKTEAIISYLIGQVLPVLKSVVISGCGIDRIVKFLAWLVAVEVSGGAILAASISAELYSYGLDRSYSQSYVTHQLVVGGQFLGTPILKNEGQFYECPASTTVVSLPNGNYINVTEPDPYQTSFSPGCAFGFGWHMPLLFSGSPGDEDQYTWPPLLENHRMDLLAYKPTINFHPFVAYHQDGALLQLTKRNKIWAPGAGYSYSGNWPGSFGYYGLSPFSDADRFHLQVSKISSNSNFLGEDQFDLWVHEGTKDPPVSTVPGGLCWPIMGEWYLQSAYVNVYDLYTPEVPRLDFEETQIPNYELNDPYWNDSDPDPFFEEFLGDVTFKYQPGVTVNGEFKELPDFPNRFEPTSDPMPLSSVVGLPLTVEQRVKGIKAFMEGNFTEASYYPLPYPGTTVFRDTVEASAAEFDLKFSPSGVTTFLSTDLIEAPLFAELTGFPSGVVVSTVSPDGSDGTCWGCEVSQERVRVWLDESGRSPVNFRLDFSEVDDIGEDGLDVDLQVRLTTGCGGVLDVYEKRFHVQPNCQQNPFPCQGEEIVSFGGYNYDIVEIGCQCWFAENLRTTTYADGTAIPTEGPFGNSGGTKVYGQGGEVNCYNYSPDIDACDENQSLAEYGRLYNWYAVNDPSGLCPTGWHVPTGWEWLDLQLFLDSAGFDGTEGTALKSASGWTLGGNGTDDFGFSGLPGGLTNMNINFNVAGQEGRWWSSTINELDGDAWFFLLSYDQPYSSLIINGNPIMGHSVRCLKDAD